MEVWAKEREAAGLRSSLSTLTSEVQRLNSLCAERKEAEDSLKKKWKKIEEFDSRRSELESICTALLDANKVGWAVNFDCSYSKLETHKTLNSGPNNLIASNALCFYNSKQWSKSLLSKNASLYSIKV